ncbi:MAG: ribose transport system permease protein [Verrucomicrobiales bacterium]|jgi:ribose transport system permease protein
MAPKRLIAYLYSDYGMLAVLLLLGLVISLATIKVQYPEGRGAADQLGKQIAKAQGANARVLIVARPTEGDQAFSDRLSERITKAGGQILGLVHGSPQDARRELERLNGLGNALTNIATVHATSDWKVLEKLPSRFPALGQPKLLSPRGYRWPTFLKQDNLINVANQIAVIAIMAIGMTMVIITAGIDLSVGSLVALSAVVAAWLIKNVTGGLETSAFGLLLAMLAAMALCGSVGLFNGLMVTRFSIPPFIVTLAMMLIASGSAFMISKGDSIFSDLPESFKWLGVGADLGIPNAIVLMLVLYAIAHVVMEHTPFGRHIYAVGGNPEAARLSGVPVKRVLVSVYMICGILAGLGGIIVASQLKSGDPNFGKEYELKVIAAVVIGGTSLLGGEGKILGTLIGAFIIASIENGMNLMGLKSYPQKVMLGVVILSAVLLDQMKKKMANTVH